MINNGVPATALTNFADGGSLALAHWQPQRARLAACKCWHLGPASGAGSSPL
jgi:hypothetical protein